MFSRIVAFITVFLILACTIAAVSAAVYDSYQDDREASSKYTPTEYEEINYSDPGTEAAAEYITSESVEPSESTDDAEEYQPRYTAPEFDNTCYYSDDNVYYASSFGMPNCTCYAWGREYELLGEKPELCLWDARCWYDYNRENGIYDYGDTPREGAVACWEYSDGGSGHVAVVESVDGDTVTFSNSAYEGAEFYVSTAPADDPSNGRDTWIFQGYIYPDA